ncbi:putative alanine racemase-domain-containing protein, partial [Spinellus fusiger]
MVQDTGLGQEMFVAVHRLVDPQTHSEKLACYKYTNIPSPGVRFRFPSRNVSDRTSTYCISPPGESLWVTRAYASTDNRATIQNLYTNETSEMLNATMIKKYPIPHKAHVSAVVKIYDTEISLNVGQMVEVIGILNRDLYHAQRTAEKQTHELMDGNLSQYDDIPIIHAIFVVPMSGKSEMFTEQDTKRVLKSASTTRDSLIDYLSTAFRGDKLASEYMMLQLISRITAQKDDIKIGQFSLNLYNFETSSIHTIKSNDGNVLYTLQDPSSMWLLNILKNIVPLLVEMPLNIEVFNNSSFSPESINENLHAGILQLLPGTLLLLDETVLSEGILQKIGVRNIQALMHVMHRQSLRYMFPFDEFEFDVDLSVFTISMRKSILPHHCVLRIESDATTFSNKYKKVPLHTSKDIQDFRIFLEASKYADYEISDEMAKYIQDEFVKERKEAEANNTALPTEEDLSLRLSLSRLVTVSFGKKSLTKEYYQHAMTMEMERKQR